MDPFIEQIVNFGVLKQTVALILMLPIAATFIAFCRQIIGIRGLGIYITLIIAFIFVAMGLKYGVIIFFVIMITATFTRFIFKKIRILYLPKMAIILTSITLVIFLMFLLGSRFNIEGFRAISIFPILMMTLVAERLVTIQIERGLKLAIIIIFETFILALFSYFIINWLWLEKVLFKWPIPILLFLVLFNIALGKWSGLRLTEYFRFKELGEYIKKPKKK